MSYVNTAALGAEEILYDTRRGVFRPGGRGGGIFDGNIAGLGDTWDWLLNPWGSAAAAAMGPSTPSADTSTADATQAAQVFSQAAQTSSAGGGSYPWGVYSADTLALQKVTNASLKQFGYCPITEDGKLGKATCGARLALKSDIPGMTNPSTCQGYTTPSRTPCGGGSAPSAPSTLTPAQQAAMMQQYGGGTDWKKYLLFAGGAALVLGAAYYIDKKRKK
jgi:hypothetical protein